MCLIVVFSFQKMEGNSLVVDSHSVHLHSTGWTTDCLAVLDQCHQASGCLANFPQLNTTVSFDGGIFHIHVPHCSYNIKHILMSCMCQLMCTNWFTDKHIHSRRVWTYTLGKLKLAIVILKDHTDCVMEILGPNPTVPGALQPVFSGFRETGGEQSS